MNRATEIRVSCKTAGPAGVIAGLGHGFFASLKVLDLWYERARQRCRLAQLDEHLLRDIGVDRTAAMEEAYKPFWRD